MTRGMSGSLRLVVHSPSQGTPQGLNGSQWVFGYAGVQKPLVSSEGSISKHGIVLPMIVLLNQEVVFITKSAE
ncbi:hypothetical protein RJ640_015374 [Escallonia rubra]|uniref:Uncharacterized protein n=1 Tax=Escallonia rubra TaxID=112253 RepID=A0AA88QKM0_9ASTE|nr:hypothetical protein RJ640_015374 [Escallonia rubra]